MNRPDRSLEGWIRLYRSLLDHSIRPSERLSCGQAWIDLLLLGIPCFRLGRALVFDTAERDAWLEQRREGPRGTDAA